MVLSYGFWQRRFGGDPSVIGRVVYLNKKPAITIGITPFAFATLGGQRPDIWMPMVQQPYFIEGSKVLTDWTDSSIRMWGRLTSNVSAKTAEEELRGLTNELRREHPKAVWDNEFIQSSPGGHLQVMQPEMYSVAAMVGVLTLLILAVSCAILGGLLLARAVTREQEIGIRIAIGAGRARIFRQLCTESMLLAILGSVTGVAMGYAVLRIALVQSDAPKWLTATPDWRVLLFTAGMTVAGRTVLRPCSGSPDRPAATTQEPGAPNSRGSTGCSELCIAHRCRIASVTPPNTRSSPILASDTSNC